MKNIQTDRVLIIDSRDCLGVASAFRSKFERHGCEVTVTSDDADRNTDVLHLLQKQKFDLILFFCSEVYIWEDARWAVATFDWSILGCKKDSMNGITPLIAVTTAPDEETLSRLREVGAVQIIDRGDKPTASQVMEAALGRLKRNAPVAA